MRQAGEVTYADAHKQHRNEGWVLWMEWVSDFGAGPTNVLDLLICLCAFCRVVEFATYSDMKNAIDKLDNTELNGRRVRLIEDKDARRGSRRRSRSRSSSRSRSRSRSRRRSRSRSRSRFIYHILPPVAYFFSAHLSSVFLPWESARAGERIDFLKFYFV